MKTLELFLREKSEREKCLIEPDILPYGGKGFFYGFPGIGKSLLMLQLGFDVVNGMTWLGALETRAAKVAYLQCELPEGNFRDRVRLMAAAYPGTPADSLYFHTTKTLKISARDDEWRAYYEELVAIRPILWIIDPEYKVFVGDENQAKDVGPFFDVLDGVCQEIGCSVILVSHRRKRQLDDQRQGVDRGFEEMPGSQRKGAWADTTMRLENTRRGKRLVVEKTRYGEAPEEVWLTFDKTTLRHLGDTKNELEELVTKQLAAGPKSMQTLKDMLTDLGYADITARRVLERMEREERLVMEPMAEDKRQKVVRLR